MGSKKEITRIKEQDVTGPGLDFFDIRSTPGQTAKLGAASAAGRDFTVNIGADQQRDDPFGIHFRGLTPCRRRKKGQQHQPDQSFFHCLLLWLI